RKPACGVGDEGEGDSGDGGTVVRRRAWSVERGAQTSSRAKRGICFACVLLCVALPASAQSVDDATTLLRTGKYEQAAAAFTKVPPSDDEWVTAQRGLVRSLIALGKYDEAES